MRKKFTAVYALMAVLALGSTTLTSCVDDNESASVTAIRDAKAKQLTALANYQDVKAQNEKIIAEAEAAIKNAKAKAKEIQNELDGLDLEKAQATIATEIETAQAKAQAELLKQKAALERAKAALIAAADAADAATQAKIDELLEKADALMNGGVYWADTDGDGVNDTQVINGYNSIYGQDGLNDRLLQKKADRVKADYELVDIKLEIAEKVREEEKALAVNEALLAEYQKYDNTDLDAAEKAYNEASLKLPALQELVDEAKALYQAELNEKVTPALNDIDKTELMQYINGDQNGYRVNNYISYERHEAETITFNFDDGTAGRYTPTYALNQIVVNEEDLAAAVTNADRNAKIAEQKLKDAEKAQTEGLKDDAITLDGVTTYKELKTAVADAKKAFEEDPTDSNKWALQNAEQTLEDYEKSLQDEVDDAQEYLDSANEEVEIINEINKVLTGDAFKAYTAKYEAYIAAVDAAAETQIAAWKAQHNWQVQNELANGLKSIVDAHTDWLALINQTEQAINDNKKNIATMTANDGQTTEAIKQQYIAILDQEIARLEKEIAIKQAQYDGYMTQIEALINGDTGTEEPETPEEGGEETPAE